MPPLLKTLWTATGRSCSPFLFCCTLFTFCKFIPIACSAEPAKPADPFLSAYEEASDKQKKRWKQMASNARGLIDSGRYDQAKELLKKDAAPESLAMLAELLVATGQPAKALGLMNLALKKQGLLPVLLLNRGRAQEAMGLFADAFESYQQGAQQQGETAKAPEIDARLELARLLAFLGRRTAVVDQTDWFYSYYQTFESDQAMSSEALSVIGRAVLLAAQANEDYKDGFRVLTLAQRKAPEHIPTLLAVANAYQSKYQYGDAEGEYRSVLAINPRSVQALTGLAGVLLRRRGYGEADRLCRLALKVNPRSVEARLVLLQLELIDEDIEGATRILEEALVTHPGHPHILCLQAALAYSLGKTADFQEKGKAYEESLRSLPFAGAEEAREVKRIGDGELAYTISEMLMLFHRVEESLTWARKAVRADPVEADHLSHLGVMLMRNGLDDEAEKVLNTAFAKDSFNVWVYNLAKLVKRNADYQRFESKRFGVRVLTKHLPVLRPYVGTRFDQYMADCESAFGYQVKERIELAILRNHSDFSARVTGLPHLDASGATFGPFVALVEPMAWRKRKQWLDWQAVALHEIAHVVTLKGSGYRIPRWLTEGMSVYMEGWIDPNWDIPFKTMVVRNAMPAIARFNRMFHRPEEGWHVPAAYHGAGLFVRWLVEEQGADVLPTLVKAYRDKKTTPEAFKIAAGKELAELEVWYHKRLVEYAESLQVPVIPVPPKAPLDELQKSFEEAEDNLEEGRYLLQVLRGRQPRKAQAVAEALVKRIEEKKKAGQAGKEFDSLLAEAFVFLAGRQLKDHPDKAESWLALAGAADKNNAHVDFLMGVARINRNDFSGAATWFEEARRKFPRFIADTSYGNPYSRLIECYDRLKQPEKAAAVLDSYTNIRRNTPDLFRDLAGRMDAQNRTEKALEAYRKLMAVDPFEASDHVALAALLEKSGRKEEAERERGIAKACKTIHGKTNGKTSAETKESAPPPAVPKPKEPVEDEELKTMLEEI